MKLFLSRIAQLRDMFRGKSKKENIKDYMLQGNTITPREAIKHFDNYRLADVVFKLKKEGYNIVNLNNKGCYAEYQFVGGTV